jgi:cbb3-type cytochrome oxidase subunit 3
MTTASACYLAFTFLLWILFVAIVLRSYNPRRKAKGEQPKYRMMEED